MSTEILPYLSCRSLKITIIGSIIEMSDNTRHRQEPMNGIGLTPDNQILGLRWEFSNSLRHSVQLYITRRTVVEPTTLVTNMFAAATWVYQPMCLRLLEYCYTLPHLRGVVVHTDKQPCQTGSEGSFISAEYWGVCQ